MIPCKEAQFREHINQLLISEYGDRVKYVSLKLLQMLFTYYLYLLFESSDLEPEIVPVIGFLKRKKLTFLVKPIQQMKKKIYLLKIQNM